MNIWDKNGDLLDAEEPMSNEDLALIIEAVMLDTMTNEEIEYTLENFMPD